MLSILIFLLEILSLPYSDNPCFELKIQNDIIRVNESSLDIIVTFSGFNCSNESMILYNLNSQILMPFIEEKEYCKEDVAAGMTFYISNEAGEFIFPEVPLIPDSIDYKPMPKEKLETLLAQSKIEFAKNTRVFKPHEKIDFKQKIRLQEYQLEKGVYYLHLLYFSGPYITNYVDADQIAKDKRSYTANVYQGCIKSNEVRLIVN